MKESSLDLERFLNWATIIIAISSFVFVVTNHFHLWDKWRRVDLLEKASSNFDLSYTPGASTPIYPNDPEWKPLLKLFKDYSKVQLLADKEPRVIARFQAVSSGKVQDGVDQFAEWTAPGTPIAVLYIDWPGNPGSPGDYQIIGTIGDLHDWIRQDQEDFSFLVSDIILGTLSLLIGLLGVVKIRRAYK